MSQREIVRQPNYRTPEDRRTWETLLGSAAEAWSEIELASVGVLRTSGLTWISLDDLPPAAEAAACSGMRLTPVYRAADRYRCVIGTDDPRSWAEAFRERDNRAIGELLGYPDCCVEWFLENWVRRGTRDWISPAWAEAPWELNQIPMRLDVRLTPWVPCGPGCAASIERARLFLELGRRIDADVASIEALLRARYEWDARNGAAIVHGGDGAFRFVHDTDPEIRDAFVYAGDPVDVETPWTDNGFRTYAAQRKAHELLEGYVRSRGEFGAILDLGAGNGDLLARFPRPEGRRHVAVEADRERAIAGIRRHDDLHWIVDRLETTDSWAGIPFDTLLLAPQRLIELEGPRADLVRFAARLAKRIVAYTWDGEDIIDLARRAGLRQAWTAVGDGTNAAMEVTV